MTVVGADTRQRITEIAAMLDNHRHQDASTSLHALVKETPAGALSLVAPELFTLIDRFFKQRKRELTAALHARLEQLPTSKIAVVRSGIAGVPNSPPKLEIPLSQQYAAQFAELGEHHIFQWATYYQDTLRFIFTNTLAKLRDSGQWHSEIESVGFELSRHSADIFGRGFQYQVERGLSAEFAAIKSISGLQNFLYQVVLIFTELRETIRFSKDAELIWSLASSVLTGILRGYGKTRFGAQSGWFLLKRNSRIWLSPLGFCRGLDALSLLDEFPKADVDGDVYITILPTLLAVERLANRFQGEDIFLPKLSRVSVLEPARLDLTFSVHLDGATRELLISSFFGGTIVHELPIRDALSLQAAVVVGRLSEEIHFWAEENQLRVLNAQGVNPNASQVQEFSELVHAQLDSQTSADAATNDPTVMNRNYATEFPLNDPDFRRQFLVERHSVKLLLQQFEGSTGVHLWCSVRRSGKTTAAGSLADPHGQSVVIMQTMDQLPEQQSEQNILKRKLREVFLSGDEIDPNFFRSVVDECVLAASAAAVSARRVVFIIDEYETLFGLINAYVSDDAGFKYKVALPLLSQMVTFARQNLLIFMGQRPDAYLILSAQNQLSPLVRQYNFPLFAHIPGATDTEFTQLLRRVLREQLPFDTSFSDQVYQETSGHPYLTVNLMVDFCDWLITNNHRLDGAALDSAQFVKFSKDRLTAATLKRSPHYEFFHHMLAEYLSESGRASEPWLSAITSILQEIARKHHKAFACPISSFEQLAAPFGAAIQMTPARLLTSGSLSNFLRNQVGQVTPGVRLMARLAGSAAPHIN